MKVPEELPSGIGGRISLDSMEYTVPSPLWGGTVKGGTEGVTDGVGEPLSVGVAECSKGGEGGCVSPSGAFRGKNDGISSKYGV